MGRNEMSGFWKHYAQANDDIRTQLIDKGWFEGRGINPPQSHMESDVYGQSQKAEPSQSKSFYGGVSHKDPNVPEGLQQPGFGDGIEHNPDATRDAVHEFYGVQERPSGDELGGDAQDERTLWQQHEAVGGMEDLYGSDMQQSESEGFYGEGEAPDETQANDLYGYDALEEDETQEMTQRM